jgi:uncharacterized protein YwgA
LFKIHKLKDKMERLSIELTNPLAKNLLNDLETLNLIKIVSDDVDERFLKTLAKLKTKQNDISMEEIIKEVDEVRQIRYNENNI